MPIVHLVAHTIPATYPLADAATCWRLWRMLRLAVERVFAACLMPNHLHLVAAARSPDELRWRVAQVLAGFARSAGRGRMWSPIPRPVIIGDPGKLARQIRYALLNANRAGFYDDPACAIWSTYRDVIGATLDPWVDVADLAAVLGRSSTGFVEWFQTYVSSDPSVQTGGTPLPIAAPPRLDGATPLELVDVAARAAAATALCTERRRASIARHGFVLAARHQGWRDANALGEFHGTTDRTIRRLALTPDDALLRATALYLGDERLLTPQRFRRAA